MLVIKYEKRRGIIMNMKIKYDRNMVDKLVKESGKKRFFEGAMLGAAIGIAVGTVMGVVANSDIVKEKVSGLGGRLKCSLGDLAKCCKGKFPSCCCGREADYEDEDKSDFDEYDIDESFEDVYSNDPDYRAQFSSRRDDSKK
jgi:hypothetical protein